MRSPAEPVIEFPVLKAARSQSDHDLHQAAVEWSLAEPIIIDSPEDIRSKPNWQERLEPYHHQVRNLMTFCRRLPVTLIADDVGLGKTISAGLILSELMIRNHVSRTLVVCPSLLGPQWIEELEVKFGISGRWVTGGGLNIALRGDSPVIATTYQSISSRLSSLDTGAFDMLILDEAHKVRNLHGTPNPPRFATRLRNALEQRLFKYVVMLTATPIQNRLWDLYSLLDCLAVARGHQHPLGTRDQFRRKYIADAASTARQLNQNHAEEFRRVLRQYMARTRREDVQLLFPRREVRLFHVPPSALDLTLQRLVAEHIESANGLLRTSLATAMMSSPRALLSQLKNMAEKNSRWTRVAEVVDAETRRSLEPPSKLAGLLQIIEELRNRKPGSWRAVVFTTRKETQKLIVTELEELGIACGVIRGGASRANYNAVKRYSSEPPEVNVLVSTDAGAEGVNLQAGNVLINYDLPWNPMIVEQRIGRVQRLASQHAHVVIINLAVEGSPEEKIVARLMEKLQTISHTVGDIESILEASGGDSDSPGESFEARIRDLVFKSLKGQDTRRAIELADKSIDDAKKLFEDQRTQLDNTLGKLEDIHDTGPPMPRLDPPQPGMPFEDFVRKALISEGWELSTVADGMLKATRPGAPAENIVFSEDNLRRHSRPGLFHGRSPNLYAPGKPHFERLVQRWLDRAQHITEDLRSHTRPRARSMCEAWVSRIRGAVLKEVDFQEVESHWQGRTEIRVTVTNAVDSYETLVHTEHIPPGHECVMNQAPESDDVVTTDRDPNEEFPQLAEQAMHAVVSDSNIASFESFYSQRLEEEIAQAGNDPQLRARLTGDLQPATFGHVVGQRGVAYETCRVVVRFEVDGHGAYAVDLVLNPAGGRILREPLQWARCEETGVEIPESCLETCEFSGMRVLQHLLVSSDESGRKALARHTQTCDRTGRVALLDEYQTSDVSGQTAVASAFTTSPVSGRRGLPGEFAVCEFTGESVLRDEIARSEISGRSFRKDQLLTSAVSGVSGHRSEFITCAATGEPCLPDETVRSDISGDSFRSDRAVRSERPPHRVGMPAEAARCAASGKTLLIDEVGQCQLTLTTIDTELLAESELSGITARRELLVTCEVTGKKLLPVETALCAVSGRRALSSLLRNSRVSKIYALPEELATCEINGVDVLPSELAVSCVSGLKFRNDEIVKAASSDQVCHVSEAVKCGYTGQMLVPNDAGISDYTGKPAALSELLHSERSGRAGVAGELKRCEETGRLLLADELGKSAVSGKVVDSELLVRSASSQRPALPDELVRCSVSGKLLLPDETVRCHGVEGHVDRHLTERSELSNRFFLRAEMSTCAVTGKRAAADELVTCQLTGDHVIPSGAAECSLTGVAARKDQLVRSSVSHRWMVPSKAKRSAKSKRILCPDEVVYCHWNECFLATDETASCRRTGLTFSCGLLTSSGGELKLIRALATGRLTEEDMSELLGWVRKQANGKLRSAQYLYGASSPKGTYRLMRANLHPLLGLRKPRNAWFLMKTRPDPQIVGTITVDAPTPAGWKPL